MGKPHELLAGSLKVLKGFQDNGQNIFKSSDFSRVHRERLIKNGFLKEIISGWLMIIHPEERSGDSTSWHACFWDFCSVYCHERFGEDWHLSPEQSLKIYAGSTIIPSQVVVYSPCGSNNLIQLPFKTSLYDLKSSTSEKNSVLNHDKLRVYKLENALIKVPPSFYLNYPLDAQICLAQIKNIAPLLELLLEGGHSKIAGRLAGAFNKIGWTQHAKSIVSAMTSAGYSLAVCDPFIDSVQVSPPIQSLSRAKLRIQMLWENNRSDVLDMFPATDIIPNDTKNINSYMERIDDIYQHDAYHSLSIEGYHVTEDLINKVRSGAWNPTNNQNDSHHKDALAARGYWQAFQRVRSDIKKALTGQNINTIVKNEHLNWYRELFQPSVQVGLIPATALAGYRTTPVYLRNSRHIPPRSEVVYEMMEHLFHLFSTEENAAVKAILGHWLFGYIHPFQDGNGRIARFVMNIFLASQWYPWTIIQVNDRADYLSSLETASVEDNIKPFVKFVATQMKNKPS